MRVTLFLVLVLSCSVAAAQRPVPDFNVMLNDDGDLLFLNWEPQASVRSTRASIDALRGTPVKTLMLSVGAGSDILHYPTKVANIYGWRETRWTKQFEKPAHEEEMWYPRIVKERTAITAGVDVFRVAGEHARAAGLRFFPSYRMNDDHFVFDPFEYPLTGEFWLNNHERLRMGEENSPIESQKAYGQLLDFSHKEVRDFRLAIIREVIDRYGDISDGIELDFNRVQMLFARGKAEANAHLVTEMVGEVRRMLDEASKKNSREMYLVVRVPPTLKNCRWAGLEVEKWIRDRMVDVVCPSQLMTLAHDMPIDEFVKLAEPVGVKVYPSLYPRTSYQWPFVMVPSPATYAVPARREVEPDLVRGAASNYWHMGAAGFQLFNFHHEDMAARPFSDRFYRILRDLADPAALTIADKRFAVTPAYYLDHEDSYEYRKQLPVLLAEGVPTIVRIYVGEDLQANLTRDTPPYVAVRLGLSKIPADASIEMKLNGRLPVGSFGRQSMIEASGARPPDAGDHWAQLRMDDHTIIRQGWNEVVITARNLAGSDVRLTAVQVGIVYDRKYLELLYK
ncbi:MAG: hypothetical protein SGI86_21645 [Deltaproteobacteria bacterium]|nr:hypothetical protein [Deltaproteobacteria bacterium]